MKKLLLCNRFILLRRTCFFAITLLLLLGQYSTTSLALSSQQRKIFNKNIGYYDYDPCSNQSHTEDTVDTGTDPIYIVGDSITNGAKDNLKTAFKDIGMEVSKINAEDGRAVSRPTMSGVGGIDAVKEDKDIIKNSNSVVVALGTNSGVEDLNVQIPKIIREIKSINSNTTIYWVNVFSTGEGSSRVNRDKINSQIKKNSSEGYSVINTVSKGIEVGSDRTHPTPAGSKKFAEIIAKAISSGSNSDTDNSTSNSVSYTANQATIDTDGSGGSGGSSTYQPRTNLRTNGKLNDDKTSLDASKINFYVLYGAWAQKRGISLGDIAKVEYKGKSSFAVFGDNHGVGDANSEWSEISSALARSFGGSGDGSTGTLTGKIKYTIYPGSHKKLDVSPSAAVGAAATALPLYSLQQKIDEIGAEIAGGSTTINSSTCGCSAANGESYSGSISPRVGYGTPKKGQENLQKAVVMAGQKFDVDPNFIAAFYYAENSRTNDSTNNADSANGVPVTGDGKWRDPAPPDGNGAPWDPPNKYEAYGPFQFITSTWQAYKPEGANDWSDRLDLFKEALAAGKYLAASGAKGTTKEDKLRQAAFAYNRSGTYVQSVINTYNFLSKDGGTEIAGSGDGSSCNNDASTGGDASLKDTIKVTERGRFITMPSKYACQGRKIIIDSRVAAGLAYIVTKYNLCITAGLENGHASHGAGVSVGLVPKDNAKWKETTEKAARDIGWWGDGYNDSRGSKSTCSPYDGYGRCMYEVYPNKFPKWLRWIGYNGAQCHGDPNHIFGGCNAHLHISWASPNGRDAVSSTAIQEPIPAVYTFQAPVPSDLKELIN